MKLDVEIPDGAEERAWRVVRAAFEAREPARQRRSPWRPAVVLVAVGALAGVLASPPGRSVIRSIREAVGVEKAQRDLFSLPAPGRLLVESSSGPWVVGSDGSRRLLGPYREAAWSPFGRFLVATRPDELVTMDPQGHQHWTLARRAVASPAWGGTHSDTRIGYVTNRALRIVAGDGTGDRPCLGAVSPVAPAWQPGSLRLLAAQRRNGSVGLYDGRTCRRLWQAPQPGLAKLEWSTDGKLLLAFAPHQVRVYDLRGRVVAQDDPSDATRDADATFLPGTHEVAVARLHRAATSVFLLATGRTVFSLGRLRQLVPSPDGRWLLATWPAADQWIFVRVRGPRKIVAVSGITKLLGGGSFPTVSGWCCASSSS